MHLFVDTETTGLPRRGGSLKDQPYVVQLAAILCDESRTQVSTLNSIVAPEGWTIPVEASAIHGLTTEMCRRRGRRLSDIMSEFCNLWNQATLVVAHNINFDLQLLQFSASRCGCRLKSIPIFCTMKESTDIVNLPRRKWPKLQEAHEYFFGEEYDDSHDALADVRACMRVFYALKDCAKPSVSTARPKTRRTAARMQSYLAGIEEVQEHQRLIDSLIGLHRSSVDPVDWSYVANQPDPPKPTKLSTHERTAQLMLKTFKPDLVDYILFRAKQMRSDLETKVLRAREKDQDEYDSAMREYSASVAEAERYRQLAKKVFTGDDQAYCEALSEAGVFDSPIVGRDLSFTTIAPTAAEIHLFANAETIIPGETKKLLASGRASVRATSKKVLGSLYQDHICSCVLRVARDVFSVLPMQFVIIHASVELINSVTGHPNEYCVLSVAMSRSQLNKLNFDALDPSDSMQNFQHRTKFSKNEMIPVEPLDVNAALTQLVSTASSANN